MTPYAGLVYFLFIVALLCPMVLVAWRTKKASPWWIVLATVVMLWLQYGSSIVSLTPSIQVPELYTLAAFGFYQWALVVLSLRFKSLRRSILMVPLSILPLVLLKYPIGHGYHFGFSGISYATFRVLDVLWSITDGVLLEVGGLDLFLFLFFFPTLSSGPIDRFRRFRTDWRRVRTWSEVVDDLNAGVPMVFRGLLYKYVIATLIERHVMVHAEHGTYLHGAIYYAYTYSAHLFFDFAGYSAFAVGVSRWFGVRSPENFRAPWAAPNIREFWNRWHISLSMWFRDHIYMRFVLMASKKKWFKNRDLTSSVGYFVSFGLMGVWHGHHYLKYGIYHASLFAVFDAWTRWRKRNPTRFTAPAWRWVAHALTINAVVFGLWLFSGHPWLTKEDEARSEALAQKAKIEAEAAAKRVDK
jgi:membrane protein involved in D-alanine export